jgi:hypothetical protein
MINIKNNYYIETEISLLTTLILPQCFLKRTSSACSSFGFTIYLICLVNEFFNRQSAYLWVLTVLLFSPTCSFIRMRQTS